MTSSARPPSASRCCTRSGCPDPAVATLTYVYAASTAVVGPLAAFSEPHSYDLCQGHARSLTAPRGWQLVRHTGELAPPPPGPDDLVALAEAVREAGDPGEPPAAPARGHLRLVPPSPE